MTNRLNQGYVPSISALPVGELRPQALRFLLRLRQMAGKARRLVTRTKSLAQLFGCCVNTIRNWRNDLVDYDYIHWLLDPRQGTITILIREKIEPFWIQEQLEHERVERRAAAASPRPWWTLPAKSVSWLGGAQRFAPIKARLKKGSEDGPENSLRPADRGRLQGRPPRV